MKDLFYGILSFMLIMLFWWTWDYPKELSTQKYKGGIILDKNSDFFIENHMRILMRGQEDSVIGARFYDIVYDKYQVGDTIK